jgi:beta-aspartyl-peptidase (threonine type)
LDRSEKPTLSSCVPFLESLMMSTPHEIKDPQRPTAVIAIHGGAGTVNRQHISSRERQAYHGALRSTLEAGQRVLASGGSAMDAVCVAVRMLEDCPLFNAGHGAVFTEEETHELDAAVMDGHTLAAGAVAGVRHVRNPVEAARQVMAQGQHVLMIGQGAEKLAQHAGLVMVEPSYFSTAARLQQLHNVRAQGAGAVLDHDGAAALLGRALDESKKMGTVGAVALDQYGHVAAATSTGGLTNKRVGRVGDTPLIGAGTYADDRTAAVSCTGHGESFIRVSAAHDVCARMAYAGASLEEATAAVVHQALPAVGGEGGLIAVDRFGNVSLSFNSEGMYRGLARVGGELKTFIFRDD